MNGPPALAALQAAIAAEPGRHSGRGLSRHDAYRQFWCIDCRIRPYSPGRTRCDECHADHLAGRTSAAVEATQ